MESKAMKVVREEMGFTNVKLMIPFCRTVEEAMKVNQIMDEQGLRRGEKGLGTLHDGGDPEQACDSRNGICRTFRRFFHRFQ